MKTKGNKAKRIAVVFGIGLSLGAQEILANDYEKYADLFADNSRYPKDCLHIETGEQYQLFKYFQNNGLIEKVEAGYYYVDEEALQALLVDDFNPTKTMLQTRAVESALEKAFGEDVDIDNIPPFRMYVGTQDWGPPTFNNEEGNPIANEPTIPEDWDNGIEFDLEEEVDIQKEIDAEKLKNLDKESWLKEKSGELK